jgi:hypothetical protein
LKLTQIWYSISWGPNRTIYYFLCHLDIVCFGVQIRVQACRNESILCQLLKLVLFLLISYLLEYYHHILHIWILFTSFSYIWHLLFVCVFKSSIFCTNSLATSKIIMIVLFFIVFIIFLLMESYLIIWIMLLSSSMWCWFQFYKSQKNMRREEKV